jgi:hypothetical protein
MRVNRLWGADPAGMSELRLRASYLIGLAIILGFLPRLCNAEQTGAMLTEVYDRQVYRHLSVPDVEQRAYAALMADALASAGLRELPPQYLLLVDRSPLVPSHHAVLEIARWRLCLYLDGAYERVAARTILAECEASLERHAVPEIGVAVVRKEITGRKWPTTGQRMLSICDVFDDNPEAKCSPRPELEPTTDHGAVSFAPFVSSNRKRPKAATREKVKLRYRSSASRGIDSREKDIRLSADGKPIVRYVVDGATG